MTRDNFWKPLNVYLTPCELLIKYLAVRADKQQLTFTQATVPTECVAVNVQLPELELLPLRAEFSLSLEKPKMHLY